MKMIRLYFCCQVFIMLLFQSSDSMHSNFYKDILMNHDVLIDANCFYDYELLKSYFHSQVGYFRMKPNDFVLNMMDLSLIVLTCPTNKTELFQYLQSVGIVSTAKTVSPQPVYIVQWPESITTCSSVRHQTLPNLQDDIILQEIVTRYPMDFDVYLSFNCQDFLGVGNNAFNAYILIELYSIRNTIPIIQPISNGVFNRELFSEDIINKVERRSNFHGVPLIAVDYDDVGPESFDVIQEDLMQDELQLFIALSLNISLTIINGTGWITNPCCDDGNITSDLDCPLSGMGKQILEGEADFTFTNTELVSYRVRYLKSFQPIQVTRVIAIFRQPLWSLLRNIYIKSFNPLLWLVLLITSGMIIFTVIAIANIQVRIAGNRFTPEAIDVQDSQYISNAILWLISSITMQGWYISAASLPFKIIHISTLMLALVCIAVYSGTIFSILSNQKGPIKDYQDLERSNLPVVADGRMLMAIHAAEVLNKNRGISKSVDIQMTYNNNVVDTYETFSTTNKVLLTSKDGWLKLALTGNITTANELCNNFSMFLDNYGIPILTVMYVHRNSSLREFLNYPFVVLIETGLRHRLANFDFVGKSVRCLEPEKQPEPFGNNEVFSVYMILVIGFASSITFLLMEKTFSFLNYHHPIRFATPLKNVSLKSLIK